VREEEHLVNLLVEVAGEQVVGQLRTAAERLKRQRTNDGRKFLLDTVSLSQWYGLMTQAAGSQTVASILAYLDNPGKAPPWTKREGKEIKDALVEQITTLHRQAERKAAEILEKVQGVGSQKTSLPTQHKLTEDLLSRWVFRYLSLVTRLKRGGA
jgi:hypothetical protein